MDIEICLGSHPRVLVGEADVLWARGLHAPVRDDASAGCPPVGQVAQLVLLCVCRRAAWGALWGGAVHGLAGERVQRYGASWPWRLGRGVPVGLKHPFADLAQFLSHLSSL